MGNTEFLTLASLYFANFFTSCFNIFAT